MKSPLLGCGLSFIAIFSISTTVAQEQIFPGLYEPDHPVPLDPKPDGWHLRYVEALRPQLKLNAPFLARMVLRPSFEGESCLRLHTNDGNGDASKSSKFFLTCYEADKNIWYSMPENSNDKKQGEVTVAVSSAPVSKARAMRLRAIWDQMLSRSKPPEKPDTSFDGQTIEFATPKNSGEVRNPMGRKSPQLFVELGHSLIRYCKADPDQRAHRMTSVEQHATSLETYLKEHPIK